MIADAFIEDKPNYKAFRDAIEVGWMGLDIGPKTIPELKKKNLKEAKTVV